MLFHNSHDPLYRFPAEAAPCGSSVLIRFDCDESDTVFLRLWDGAEHLLPMQRDETGLFAVSVPLPDEPQLLWYDFVIPRSWDTARYGAPEDGLGGIGHWYAQQPPSFQLTVYSADYSAPAFLREGILYQIFPDRFRPDRVGLSQRASAIAQAHPDAVFHSCWDEPPIYDPDPENGDNRALDFFVGTLRGIRNRLDSLAELGVTVLYLNPIFRARTNHRYDTGSYEEIDPIVGDAHEFELLEKAAAKRGIRILLDGVFSHTGADSLYFNRMGRYPSLGAYQSRESNYADWYTFTEFPDKYRSWWGFYTLPELRKDAPGYRRYLLDEQSGIVPGWIRRGACGWRLDVADELPMDLLRSMRSVLKTENENAALIGEVWEDASNKVSYGTQRSYCLGDTLDSVMNYPLRRAVIDFFTRKIPAQDLCRLILHQREVYPAPFLYSMMNLLGSHDRVRILNAMAGWDRAGNIQMDRSEAAKVSLHAEALESSKKRYLEALRLLCALPGMPSLYYGDEIGMTGMSDPWNRAPMNWKHPDNELREKVRLLLAERKANLLLRTGYLDADAPDEDTIRIRRYAVNGLDRFGAPAEGERVTVITRT